MSTSSQTTSKTYNDYNNQIDICQVLEELGYKFKPSDGRTWRTYQRGQGDKYIVNPNHHNCHRPGLPGSSVSVVGLIREHRTDFPEGRKDIPEARFINEVCCRILNEPLPEQHSYYRNTSEAATGFSISDYGVIRIDRGTFDTIRPFYPFFKNRGIGYATQLAFGDDLMITYKQTNDGQKFKNLSFPLYNPSDMETVVGLELRSVPDETGKCAYKKLAKGSDTSNGVWIGNPSGKTSSLTDIRDVYWFESGYDALAFYQLYNNKPGYDFSKAIFVSTSGTPTAGQIKNMLSECPSARHHLCFDNDEAGRKFSVNFALQSSGHIFQTNQQGRTLIIKDSTLNNRWQCVLSDSLDLGTVIRTHDLGKYDIVRHIPEHPYKDWNDQLLNKPYDGISDSPKMQNFDKEWNTLAEEPSMCFPDGTQATIVYDSREKSLLATVMERPNSYFSNSKVLTSVPVDYNQPLDENLRSLYSRCIEASPSLDVSVGESETLGKSV